MSDIDGLLRIEVLSWDAFNECHTLQDSVEVYRKAYGHYPERVLADTIYRTRDNLRHCKEHGIRLNGPRLGKPPKAVLFPGTDHREAQAYQRNHDSYVCSDIEFAEEAQASFALHFH